LEYYTGPIFETTVDEPKSMPSITGGGRFDELVGMFMDRSYPATGTTIGIERIIDTMEEVGMFPPDLGKTTAQVLVTMFDASLRDESLRVAALLRRSGLKTQLYFEPDSLRNQIGFARTKGIPFVVVLGPDELAAGKGTVRDMRLQRQEQASLDNLPELIRKWVTG
jgi:histidyl-tRNA synthetase